jgi:hypothetical protein
MSGPQNDNINLDEDIPGCEDNYYRCMMSCLRISRTWIDFFSTLALMTSSVLGAVTASNSNNPELIKIVGISTAVVTGITAGSRILKDFTVSEEAETKQLLKQIVSEYDSNKKV